MTEEYLTDDEQLEAVKHFLTENGPWLVGGVVLGAALIFGWRYYQSHLNEQAMAAAAQFGTMTDALQASDPVKSRQIALQLIEQHADSPYADQAKLTLARLELEDGHIDKAVGYLTPVMNGSKDSQLREIAKVRLARILTDQGKTDDAIKLLADPIPAAYAQPFHEARGDAYAAKKDTAHAVAEYQMALGAADVGGMAASLLELKIQDLGAVPAPVVKEPSIDLSNKAKP